MSANIPLMPRGSHFLLLRQKKVTKEKATPTIGPAFTNSKTH